MKRSRFYLPMLVTVILFTAYLVFQQQPLLISHTDVREVLFGRELNYLLFAAVLSLIVLLVRILDTLLFDLLFGRRRHIKTPQLLRQIVGIGLYLVSVAWAISAIFKYEVTALLTTTTVVAAVIGLALQDTLGNLFSGISLHIEDSFDVGDVVKAGEAIGVVESVNWRATRLRSFNNHVIVLPNSVISRERLEVFPQANLNAQIVSVGVSYDVPPSDVIEVLNHAAANVTGVSKEIPVIVRVGGFEDSAVLYEIKYWTRVYHHRDTIDAEIRKAVWYALRRRNMSIPYPIRSVHFLEERRADEILTEPEVMAHLKEIDVLAPLSVEEQHSIARGTIVHVYSKGETIIRHGDEGHSMFIIHSGEVAVRVPEGNGWREVAQLGPSSVVGEMALLTGESRTADVVAASDSIVLEIGKETLAPVLKNNPELAAAISEKVLQRRDHLAESAAQTPVDQKRTLIGKIRAYFAI